MEATPTMSSIVARSPAWVAVVAEWVADGQVFGGSYRHSMEHPAHPYDVASPPEAVQFEVSDYVGFRCAWDLAAGKRCSCPLNRLEHTRHEGPGH